ncbi:MAG TPA: hypothetical protein VF942_07930, partial [Acidimicrobiales bacterium]
MVLAFLEHVGGAPTSLSLELLTMARRVAQQMGVRLEALLIGGSGASASEILSTYGVSVLHMADDERLTAYAPAAWAHTIVQLVETAHPAVVIGTGSDRGAEV